MGEFIEVFLMVLLAAVKYLFAVLALLAHSSRVWYLDMLIVASGGTIGVLVFTYLGAIISTYLSKYHFFKFKFGKLKKLLHIKNTYGLIGLALLSPILISIPVGCIISASFEHDKLKIMRYHLLAVVFWSVLLFGLKGLFHFDISKKI
ncbi:MAG: hypothetical protein PSX81_12820 [bacterium]|nr:hypothetical protein [bacterium]